MPKAIGLAQTHIRKDGIEPLRRLLVWGCAASLILAGRAFPF